MRFLIVSIIIVFNVFNSNCQNIITIGKNDVYDFCFTPNGKLVYIADGSIVNLWDLKSKAIVATLKDGPVNTINSLDLNKDYTYLISSSLDSSLTIWDLSNYTVFRKIKLNSIANQVIFGTLNNNVIAVLRNGELVQINFVTGDILNSQKTGFDEITAISILKTEGLFAIGSSNGQIQLWDLNTFKLSNQIKAHSNFIRGLVFQGNGNNLYSCGDDGNIKYTSINFRQLGETRIQKKYFTTPWITSIDYLNPNFLGYATLNGKVVIENYNTEYKYSLKNKIYRVHFVPLPDFNIAIGMGTSNGLQIIWAKNMKVK